MSQRPDWVRVRDRLTRTQPSTAFQRVIGLRSVLALVFVAALVRNTLTSLR